MTTLTAFFTLTRPGNVLISGISIFVAALIAGPVSEHAMPVAYAVISGMLITAGANVINDWYDIDIDRVNRPERVLPSGRVRPQQALVFSIILFVSGIIFSIFISYAALSIAVITSFLLVVYSAALKKMLLWGNLSVAFLGGLAFIYGALAGGDAAAGVVPAVFAFLFHLGREILKDAEDVRGDAQANADTLPIRYGWLRTRRIVTAVFVALIAITIVPYAVGYYGLTYLLVVLPGVDGVLIIVLLYLWRRPDMPALRRVNIILKIDMLLGILAVYLG